MIPRFAIAMGAALLSTPPSLFAASWTWTWKPGPNEKSTAVVSPMKFGKKWGYAIELDDGHRETGLFAPEFFGKFTFTDAPPGLEGGRPLPVVGSFAIVAGTVGGNSTVLGWDDLRASLAKGWGVSNHSYYHKGRTFGNPPEILTPGQIREDLFWSQAVLARELGSDHAPTHFVYPNGYQPYSKFLAEFGLVSGSLVGGSGGNNPSQGADLLLMSRAYLDEGPWTDQYRKGDAMTGFSDEGPAEGAVMIDFTHGIDIDPTSANQQRWKTRLETLEERWGSRGRDEFWSAPSGELVNYAVAARRAQVSTSPGKLEVTLPDDIPGTALTVQLDGVPESTAIPTPPGGAVYRRGSTAWITSPVIGRQGAAPIEPAVKPIFKAPAGQPGVLPSTAKIAGVRVIQSGRPTKGVPLEVHLILPDGNRKLMGFVNQDDKSWVNGAAVISTIPNGTPIEANGVEIFAGEKLNKEFEIWAVD